MNITKGITKVKQCHQIGYESIDIDPMDVIG